MTLSHKGVVDPELKSALDALRPGIAGAAPASKLQALQSQVDQIDIRLATKMYGDSSFGTDSTLLKTIQENESVARILRDRRGTATLHLKGREYAQLMDRKSIISGVTSGSAGGRRSQPDRGRDHGHTADRQDSGDHPGTATGPENQERFERAADHDAGRRLRQGYQPHDDCIAGRRSIRQA